MQYCKRRLKARSVVVLAMFFPLCKIACAAAGDTLQRLATRIMTIQGGQMSKVSMAEAAKLFEVSRPTLAKHLKEGKISGNHVFVNGAKVWQLDMAELKRVYQRRGESAESHLHDDLPAAASDKAAELQSEIRVLQAKLEAAQAMIEEKDKRIDDLRKMLPGPDDRQQDRGQGRGWWPFSRR